MAVLHLQQIESVSALRAAAAAWDDLWNRSATTIPTARAEPVALWLEQFTPGVPFRALAVETDGRMVAALPLVECRACRVIRYGGLTSNYWSPNADLLVDAAADVDAVAQSLTIAIGSLDWPLLRLDLVPVDEPGWQALVRALRRAGLLVDIHHRWDVGQIAWDADVESYFLSRSKNLRRNLRRDAERLQETGPLDFRLDERFTPEEVRTRLDEIFAIEDRGWKGAAGGSVLRHPEVRDFYCRQATCFADGGLLRLARLLHGERTIAYELGWVGHGVYHSYKVSYDPEYRRFGPGHLLRQRLVRTLAERGGVGTVDFQGPQNDALDAWSTRTYPIARLVIAQGTRRGRAYWAAYHTLAGAARAVRRIGRPW